MVDNTYGEALTKKVEQATQALEGQNIGSAIKLCEEVIKDKAPTLEHLTDQAVRAKEQATFTLAGIYKDKGLIEELVNLGKTILPLYIDFPKSKLARIIRTLFDMSL
jgi:hypothetical protein